MKNIDKKPGKGFGRRGFATRAFLGMTGMAISTSLPARAITRADHRAIQTNPQKRKLGSLEVSSIGLGCMSMTSGSYNPP